MITRFYDFLPIQRYEHFDVHVYRSLLHYGDLELLQCFIISIRQYDSESVSLYVSGASWMQRDAAIVTDLFVAANACFIIFSNHWFNVWLQNNNEISEKQWFSNPVAAWADISAVKDILGHGSITSTEVYAKVALEKKIEAVNLFNGVFD